VYASTVPALNLASPLTYGTKRIRAVSPPFDIKFRRRTVTNALKPSAFHLSCLAHAERFLAHNNTPVSNSDTEIVFENTPDPSRSTYSIGASCTRTYPNVAQSLNTSYYDGDAARRTASFREIDDPRLFCGAEPEKQMCHFLYGAPMYQASTDARSVSYLWEGKFYLYDALNPAPISSIAIPAGVVPLKFFGYVGDA